MVDSDLINQYTDINSLNDRGQDRRRWSYFIRRPHGFH